MKTKEITSEKKEKQNKSQDTANFHRIKKITKELIMDVSFDYQFRLILIGDSTVGKSSLLKYFTDGRFAEVRFLQKFAKFPFRFF